ncbi:MAG: mycofactocin-coupled SDR family oxidoreductase [Nocardioidaceae bacterium]
MPEQPVALVTGAARGIGAAVVRRLVARGMHVYALDCCAGAAGPAGYPLASRADLEALAGPQVSTVVADAADPEAMREAVARIDRDQGRLDHVVANAGVIAGGAPLWETDPAVLDMLWRSDVLTVWSTAHAAVPLLRRDDRVTSLVAVASAAGTRGLWHLAAYCAAKHAVVGLVRGLAADLKGTRVTVSAICPGSTDTAMLAATARLYHLPDTSSFAGSQAVGRLLEPDEVAGTNEFACTAGPVVHGSVVEAEGGFGL